MVDAAEAVARILHGDRLSTEEVAEIRQRVGSAKPGDDLHNLVRALAMHEKPNPTDAELIARILRGSDEWSAHGALLALCSYWGLYDAYLGDLERFISLDRVPMDWDEVMDLACLALGAAFRDTKDPKYLRPLLRGYEMEANPKFQKPNVDASFDLRISTDIVSAGNGLWIVAHGKISEAIRRGRIRCRRDMPRNNERGRRGRAADTSLARNVALPPTAS